MWQDFDNAVENKLCLKDGARHLNDSLLSHCYHIVVYSRTCNQWQIQSNSLGGKKKSFCCCCCVFFLLIFVAKKLQPFLGSHHKMFRLFPNILLQILY